MRRIFSIAIIALFLFMGAMLIYEPLRITVSAFAVETIGPTATGAITALVTGIISTVGLGGFAAITMALGLIGGMLIHFFWVKADWKLRRWGTNRTRKDLGLPGVTTIPATPAGASVRPATTTTTQPVSQQQVVETPVEQEPEKEKAETS